VHKGPPPYNPPSPTPVQRQQTGYSAQRQHASVRGQIQQSRTPLKSRAKFAAKPPIYTHDKQSAKRMRLLALAFLIFYALIVTSKLTVDYRTNRAKAQNEHLSYSLAVANNYSTEIKHAIAWINNGLAEGKTPTQTVDIITRSPEITTAAILNAKGEVVASNPQNAPILPNISVQGLDTQTMTLSSITSPDGQNVPLIIKKTGKYYVANILSDNVLVNSSQRTADKIAIIAGSGQMIASNSTSGELDPRTIFNLKEAQFLHLTQPGIRTTKFVKINGQKHILAAVQIPNSSCILLEAKPYVSGSVIQNNLALFFVLFIGTCALVVTLLSSLMNQLRVVQGIQQNTEVSQQRYQAAIEGDRGGVWEVDLTGSAAFISASLAGLLGLLRQEQTMPLSKFLGLFHPDDRERFLAFARRAHMQGEFDFDIRVAHLPLILQCRGRSSTRSGKEMKRVIVGVALDITAQRAAQIRLKTAEARLHSALSSMTDSFVVWDSMNRLLVWNNRFESFFGLPQGSLHVGMDHAGVDYLASPAIADKFNYETEKEKWVEYRLKSGRWVRYIETSTAEGGHVSVGSDITELRQRQADLKENEQTLNNTVNVLKKSQDSIVELAERYESEKIRAEEASQSKSNFLASMSHELRTPLNAINGFSDIMNKEMFGPLGDPRYKEYISDILFSGQHLLSLINDILDMSKIEAGKMTLNIEVMYLHDLVAQVVRMIRGRADDANLTLDVKVDEVREIEADPRSVKQILLNLLTNAVKFTPDGGRVRVELIQKASGIIVKVSDSGIGITQENIEKIAKPFEQVDNKANTQSEGTGLGLALSKSLVELHGGKFKIESVIGKGTTVIFSLPNKPATPKEEKQGERDVSQEISKITADIADVLGQTPAPPQVAPTSPYAATTLTQPQPQISPQPRPQVQPAQNTNRPAA
jgi:two-component system, cell cycle sensor histidine kinase PleC